MNNLQITGLSRGAILKELTRQSPQCAKVEGQARRLVGPRSKREIWMEQGAAIAYLASQYNFDGATILEIGACFGYSAAVMKLAAPDAQVITLEPSDKRHANTSRTLAPLGVLVFKDYSTDFLAACIDGGREFDLIFVDGDHANVALDLPWWNLLKQDGLFLHHDYSPEGSKRECRSVWDACNHFSEQLDHQPDVLIQDDSLVGMAGWYRHDLTEVWPPEGTTLGEDGYVNADVVVEVLADQDTIDAMREESGTLSPNGDDDDGGVDEESESE